MLDCWDMEDLKLFIKKSPTAYQATMGIVEQLEKSRFHHLNKFFLYDPDYMPRLNRGPIIKLNAGYNYRGIVNIG